MITEKIRISRWFALLSLVLFLLPTCGTLEVNVLPPTGTAPTPTPNSEAVATSPPVGTDPTPIPYIDHWTLTSLPTFGITLERPPDWEAELGYSDLEGGNTRFAGVNGFFHVSAMSSDSLEEAVAAEAEHHLQPYGSQPVIETIQVNGQPARLIMPSADGSTGDFRQAAVIVLYPQPIELSGQAYEFLILWADPGHIRAIAQTVHFTGVVSGEAASGLTITGVVMDISPSVRIITLEEPVEGFREIALTEESTLLSVDGREILLREIPPGATIKAVGQPGTSDALIADHVLVFDAQSP